jgi:hypothetical protein
MKNVFWGILITGVSMGFEPLAAQKGVTTVGFQLRPIITSNIGGNGDFTSVQDEAVIDVMPENGIAWGMLVRRGFTESLSLEFGITRSERRFRFGFEDPERGFSTEETVNYINYDLPLRGMVFVQLGKQLYLSNSLGTAFVFYPTNAGAGDFELEHVVNRRAWVKVALEGNLGLEYRTKKSGYIYLGAAYHNPFSPFGRNLINYLDDDGRKFYSVDLNAGYLTLDFRYYFHEDKER